MAGKIEQLTRHATGQERPSCGDLVNSDRIAVHLGISSRTAQRMARDGIIPCVHVGRCVRFDIDDVDRALNRR